MKTVLIPFVLCFVLTFNIQKKESFEDVENRVQQTFFSLPLKSLPDAYKLKKLADDNSQKQTAYKYLGFIYDLTGQPDSARYYLNKRLDFTKEHFPKELPYFESVISYCNWGIEYVDGNILIYELTTALSEIDSKKYERQKGLIYMLIGDVFLRENDLQKASDYYDKCFSMIEGEYVVVDYYYRKSDIAIKRNEYNKARSLLQKGISHLKDKNVYIYPSYLNKLGYISIKQGDYKQAEVFLKKSLTYQRANQFRTFTAKTYLYLAYLEKERMSAEEINYLNKALFFGENDPVVTRDILLAFYSYYLEKKARKKADEYLEKYKTVSDSIFNTEKARIKLDLESRYQLSQNKKEILHQENIIKNDKKVKKLYVIVLGLSGVIILILIVSFRIKIKNHKKNEKIRQLFNDEKLKTAMNTQKTELIKEKVKAKMEERERLSLELHDGIANEISAFKFSLSSEENIDNEFFEKTINKIDQLYIQVRELSHKLNPDSIIEVEFSQLIRKICLIGESSGIKIHQNILIEENFDDIEENILLNTYRIFQELINNIIKHAKATEAWIDLLELENELLLEVKDNGVGIEHSSKSGIGLKNIKKRVSNLKGTFSITSLEGTRITINIPKHTIKLDRTPENH